MIVNVLHHKGGLHNRVTRSIALKPFKLGETAQFLQARGIAFDPIQILEVFMTVGGIPYYLDKIRKGRSAAQNIDALFFVENAALRDEFGQLYAALFEHQIDLLIDRPDGVINLCEMKWSGAPFVIDKRYAATLRERVEIFRRVTRTRKSLFLTFVTAHGIAPGDYVTELVANEVNATALFDP